MQVMHSQREVEVHDFIDLAKLHFGSGDFRDASCEVLALSLAQKLAEDYKRDVEVSVLEDNECGAVVSYKYDEGIKE